VNSVDQVTPLLPGDSGSATIITSRRFLASLRGALTIRLSAFGEDDSVRLLSMSPPGRTRVGEVLQHLSAVQLELGQLETARQFAHRGLKLAPEYGDTQREASILAILAAIKDAEDDPAKLRTSALVPLSSSNPKA
jgi:hypothetical protein